MLSPNTSLLDPTPTPTLDTSLVTSLTQCQLDCVTQHVDYTRGHKSG